MMRFAVLLALLPAAALAGAPAEPDHAAACTRNQPRDAAGPSTARLQRLDRLPPANAQLTVLRSVDGCQQPVIVRYGIGGAPDAAPRSRRP